jgi:hypothetical protein
MPPIADEGPAAPLAALLDQVLFQERSRRRSGNREARGTVGGVGELVDAAQLSAGGEAERARGQRDRQQRQERAPSQRVRSLIAIRFAH